MVALVTVFVAIVVSVTDALHIQRAQWVLPLLFANSRRGVLAVRTAAAARILATGLIAWGLSNLFLWSQATNFRGAEAAERRLLVLLDVSPSMDLDDAGDGKNQARGVRASHAVHEVLRQCRSLPMTSVIAFSNEAKPILIDAKDPRIVYNIFPPGDRAPLRIASAFEEANAETNLFAGLTVAMQTAGRWSEGCATLLIVSDGESVAPTGMPECPPAIDEVAVLGIGSAEGRLMGEAISRQDFHSLSGITARLGGGYIDANEAASVAQLRKLLPRLTGTTGGPSSGVTFVTRERAVLALMVGGTLLAAIPMVLFQMEPRRHRGSAL